MLSLGNALRAFEVARRALGQEPLSEVVLAELVDAAEHLTREHWMALHGARMIAHYTEHQPANDAELVDGLTVRQWIVGGNAEVKLRIVLLGDSRPLKAELGLEIDPGLWNRSEALGYVLHLVTGIPLARPVSARGIGLSFVVARWKSAQSDVSDLAIVERLRAIGVTDVDHDLIVATWASIRSVVAAGAADTYWHKAVEAHDRVAGN